MWDHWQNICFQVKRWICMCPWWSCKTHGTFVSQWCKIIITWIAATWQLHKNNCIIQHQQSRNHLNEQIKTQVGTGSPYICGYFTHITCSRVHSLWWYFQERNVMELMFNDSLDDGWVVMKSIEPWILNIVFGSKQQIQSSSLAEG